MTAPYPHLSKAPIEEAVLEIRTRPRPDAGFEEIRELAASLRDRFPGESLIRQAEVVVNPAEQVLQTAQQGRDYGLLLKSADGRTVVRLSLDNFAYSRLAPYTSWDEMFPTAFALWTQYMAKAEPQEVSRYAVRYINGLDLPAADLADYLTTPPVAPVPLIPTGFITRLLLQDTRRSCSAALTQATAPAAPRDRLLLLVDIDVFREGTWPAASLSADSFVPLHDLKNDIFFASVTPPTIERYR
ncbi:MAG TPA: TIGR04255 family protein [Terriglobales bacterium]|jgi:uncharacterized protein (TIGR04255 family)